MPVHILTQHSSFSQFVQSWKKWHYCIQKKLPPVGLNLMQEITTCLGGLGVQCLII